MDIQSMQIGIHTKGRLNAIKLQTQIGMHGSANPIG